MTFSLKLSNILSIAILLTTLSNCYKQRGLHALYMYTMQVRVLLRLREAIHYGCALWSEWLLRQTWLARAPSTQLSLLSAWQGAARIADSFTSMNYFHLNNVKLDSQLIFSSAKSHCNIITIVTIGNNFYHFQMNNVTYETEATESSNNRCPIQLQRETPTGLVDTTCGNEVQANQAGLCKYV